MKEGTEWFKCSSFPVSFPFFLFFFYHESSPASGLQTHFQIEPPPAALTWLESNEVQFLKVTPKGSDSFWQPEAEVVRRRLVIMDVANCNGYLFAFYSSLSAHKLIMCIKTGISFFFVSFFKHDISVNWKMK